MIEIIFINILILILYGRTYKYKQLIDDFVPRSGVLLTLGERPSHHSFYDTQRPILATITNVGVFMAACSYIYLIWGFWPALLFAVLPTNVCGVAWTTGNYYMSTVLLVLASYYFFVHSELIPILWPYISYAISICFYVAALGSTVNAIPYAFIVPAVWFPIFKSIEIWMFIVPLLLFLFGKRFQTGLKLRKEKHKLIRIESGKFNWRAIFVMVKVAGYYIVLNFWPSRLGFWHDYPKYAHSDKVDRLFWLNLICCAVFLWFGITHNYEGVVWWFLGIGIFSQFTTFGMFIAERYMVLANIGFCLILASWGQQYPYLLTVWATLWFFQSWIYIMAYRSNLTLFSHSISSFPETPENYNNLASHYIERGQKEKAIEPLLCVLKFSTQHSPNIHANLANCYAQVGYFQKALYHSEECLKHCGEHQREAMLNQVKILKEKLEKIELNKRTLKKYGII